MKRTSLELLRAVASLSRDLSSSQDSNATLSTIGYGRLWRWCPL